MQKLTTIPITLNLTYDQIEAFTTLGFPEARTQLGAFSHKITKIRNALEHISSCIRYIEKHPEVDNTDKFNILHYHLKKLTDIPYDLIQKNETLRDPFIVALHSADGLVNYPQHYTDSQKKEETLKQIKTAEILLYTYIKQYKEF